MICTDVDFYKVVEFKIRSVIGSGKYRVIDTEYLGTIFFYSATNIRHSNLSPGYKIRSADLAFVPFNPFPDELRQIVLDALNQGETQGVVDDMYEWTCRN